MQSCALTLALRLADHLKARMSTLTPRVIEPFK
jgi:hypothetical protein